MRNSDPTLGADRTKFGWLRSREAKPPPITLPRIRALETPEPNEKGDPEGPPNSR